MEVNITIRVLTLEGEEDTSYKHTGTKEEIEAFIESELNDFLCQYDTENSGIQPSLTEDPVGEHRSYQIVGTKNSINFDIKF
jgi:uncharacterized protein YpmS